MTDLLEDEQLFSPVEVAPTPAEPIAERHKCDYCDQSWPKHAYGAKSLHTKRYHPEHWTGPAEKSKVKAAARKKPATAKPKTSTSSVSRATPARSRRPLGESLARIFLQVGRVINGVVDPPTGAAIMFEAGALGAAIDNVIAGTFIDKPLQKGAAVAEKFEPLVPLLTMPAMIFMLSRNPAMSPVLEGELREALEDVLIQSMPLLRKRAARTKATIDAAAELKAIDPNLANAEDPIGEILSSFFMQPATAAASEGDAGVV